MNQLKYDITEFLILNKNEIPDNLNNLIGFIDYEVKTGKYMVFKVKNMLEKRHTGARCDNAGKKAVKIAGTSGNLTFRFDIVQ